MKEYTEQELQRMQEEAVQRVREMQERARRTAEQRGWTGSLPVQPSSRQQLHQGTRSPARQTRQGNRGSARHPAPQNQPPQQHTPPAQAPQPGPAAGLPDLFRGQTSSPLAGLMQWAGGERGILLALLATLMGEGADPTLLLALFYLAMFDDSSDQRQEAPSDSPPQE